MEIVGNLNVPAPAIIETQQETGKIVVVVGRAAVTTAAAIGALGWTGTKAKTTSSGPGSSARVPFRLLLIEVLNYKRAAELDRMLVVDPTGVAVPRKLRIVAEIGHEVVLGSQQAETAARELRPASFKGSRPVGPGDALA